MKAAVGRRLPKNYQNSTRFTWFPAAGSHEQTLPMAVFRPTHQIIKFNNEHNVILKFNR